MVHALAWVRLNTVAYVIYYCGSQWRRNHISYSGFDCYTFLQPLLWKFYSWAVSSMQH